jgi:hypothetical protein
VATVLVGVVLVGVLALDVVLVIHALSMVLSLTLSLLAVEPVLALCFRETVDFGAGKA